jgi:hypothetical protein
VQEFVEQYERRNRPVVITDVVTKWPAFHAWSKENLLKRHGQTKFRVSATVDMTLERSFPP